MIIDGSSYNDQGEYVNLIAARPNKIQSGPIRMEVRGRNKKTLCSNDSNSELTRNRNYTLLLSKHHCFKLCVIIKKLKKRQKNE